MGMPTVHRFIDPDSLAGRVVALRKRLGMQQEDLAKAARINQGTLSMIESGGTRNPSGRVLVNLALVLGTTSRYLLDGMEGELDDIRVVTEICTALSPQARATWIAVGRAMLGDGSPGTPHQPKPKPPKPHKPHRH